jgi:hypothetical protein
MSKESQEIRDQYRVPKVSIPSSIINPTVCDLLLYDIIFTEAGSKRAKEENREPNLMDGFGVKMVVTDYYVGNDKFKCIDYSNIEDIKFPCDIVAADGSKEYCGINATEYMNIRRLTQKRSPFGGFVVPQSEKHAAVLYDASFGIQYGTFDDELTRLLIELKIAKLKYTDFSDLKANPAITFPVLTVYRYLDWDYPRGSWSKNEITGKWDLLPGSEKTQPKIVYSTYNRATKIADLKVTQPRVSNETVLAIMEALRVRDKEKKDSSTPF